MRFYHKITVVGISNLYFHYCFLTVYLEVVIYPIITIFCRLFSSPYLI